MRWSIPFRRKSGDTGQPAEVPSLPPVGGLIEHYHLKEWWLTVLTDDERDHIEDVYKPLREKTGYALTGGVVTRTEQNPVDFLFYLATWLHRPTEQNLAQRLREKGAELARLFYNVTPPGYYQGRHYSTYTQEVQHLAQAGDAAEVERMLLGLIGAVEEESRRLGATLVPWYHQYLARIYLKRNDALAAHNIVERYNALTAPQAGSTAGGDPGTAEPASAVAVPEVPAAMAVAPAAEPAGAAAGPAAGAYEVTRMMPAAAEPAAGGSAAAEPPPAPPQGDRPAVPKYPVAPPPSAFAPESQKVVKRRNEEEQRKAGPAPALKLVGDERREREFRQSALASLFQHLPVDRIVPRANQPRKTFDQEALEELRDSIRERGVLEPIVVRPFMGEGADYEIVMGERRWRATRLAGLTHIPAVIRDMSDEDASFDSLVENFQREDLNPIERAEAIRDLLRFQVMKDVSKALGLSETTLRRSLELLELPRDVQAELMARPGQEGAFNEGHARALIPLNEDPESQARLVAKIKAERLNVPDAEVITGAIRQFPDKREAFLRVPVSGTKQILKALGTRESRKRAYKPKSAEQHLRSIKQTSVTLSELLDERVVDHLTTPQVNQLLSATSELAREVNEFNDKVRQALLEKDARFSEVYIHCPLCSQVELVGSERCSICHTILRRCYDCENYDRSLERCKAFRLPVYANDALNPKEHSKSFRCSEYKPKFDVQAVKVQLMYLPARKD